MLPPIENLEAALMRLPGFGRRSAARAALALVRAPERFLEPLSQALQEAKEQVCCCPVCGGFTLRNRVPCHLCSDPTRESSSLCVVEDPSDILTIEQSGAFTGRYHVLGGKLSPAHRLAPDKLRLHELLERLAQEPICEVILALSTDMDGDATAGYLAEAFRTHTTHESLRVTRLAFGLPADSGVGYCDPLTLRRAIRNRWNVIS